jgi:hypothetical protein
LPLPLAFFSENITILEHKENTYVAFEITDMKLYRVDVIRFQFETLRTNTRENNSESINSRWHKVTVTILAIIQLSVQRKKT